MDNIVVLSKHSSFSLFLFFMLMAIDDAEAQNMLRASVTGGGSTTLNLRFADKGGFYKKHGLNVELVLTSGTHSVELLMSNEVQIATAGLGTVIVANKAGGDMRQIASFTNTLPYTLFTNPMIKTAADLKGKSLAVATIGSESHTAAVLALNQLGLNKRDVVIRGVGDANRRLLALKTGTVDSAMLSPPAITVALEDGMNPLLDMGAMKVPWVFAGIATRKEYLEKNEWLVKQFLRATLEGVRYALDNPEQAKKLLVTLLRFPDMVKDDKRILVTYSDYVKFTSRSFNVPTDAALNVIKTMNEIEPLKDISLSSYVNDRLARELLVYGSY